MAVGFAVTGGGGHVRRPIPFAAPKPRPAAPPPRPAVHAGPAVLVVTIVDGDQWRRVPGALVTLGGRTARTDVHGVVQIRVPQRRALAVTVRAAGFTTLDAFEPFDEFRKVTVRIYRPDLQWPEYGVTGSRTQAQDHIALRPPFRSVWAVELGGLIEFPAVVSDGVAYIGNATATVRAISMFTGAVLWRHDTPHGKMASSPAVVGQELVYHTMDGHVYVLDCATGRLLWSFSTGSPIESSPLVDRGAVDYFGAWNGRVYALDLHTRKLLWTRSLGAKITSSLSLADGSLYLGDYAARVWSLSARTGATRWVGTVNGRVYGTPAVAHGRVFVPSSTGDSLSAFTTAGRFLWRVDTGAYVYSSPAVWHGRVFFGSYNGNVYGVSAADGRILWRVGTGGAVSAAVSVVDGVVYAGGFSHTIYGVDGLSGRVVLHFPHGDYAPVSGNGMMLLFHGYSTLYGERAG